MREAIFLLDRHALRCPLLDHLVEVLLGRNVNDGQRGAAQGSELGWEMLKQTSLSLTGTDSCT